MGTAKVVTKDQAARQRAAILAELGMSLDDVRPRAEEHELSPGQLALWRRVEERAWLLGE